MTTHDLVIVVPARRGSKRVPRKNVRSLGGRPLLDHTAAAIRDAGFAAPVLLTTDDPDAAACGRRFGWTVVDRPVALSGDRVATEPAVLHAVDSWAAEAHATAATVMMLQPTSPFRGADALVQAVELLDARPDADAVVGVTALHVGARHVLTLGGDGFAAPLGETTDRAFVPNGAVYLIRTEAFRRHASFYPPRTLALEMDPIASLDIDTEADWRLAEAILAARARNAEPAV